MYIVTRNTILNPNLTQLILVTDDFDIAKRRLFKELHDNIQQNDEDGLFADKLKDYPEEYTLEFKDFVSGEYSKVLAKNYTFSVYTDKEIEVKLPDRVTTFSIKHHPAAEVILRKSS